MPTSRPNDMTILNIFQTCVEAIRAGELIERESRKDKEFHFQNWFEKRLHASGLNYEKQGRNKYPDYTIVQAADGYELKGLAYPGRDVNFDSNSQIPTGSNNGRTVYYVFGRYPDKPDGDRFPVIDLVMCHGDFLNADHTYKHKNKNVKAFGSYGDIMIRDRKMYVVPTPFHLADGIAHHRTLILPADAATDDRFVEIGGLTRIEAAELVVGYSFDLRTNDLVSQRVRNPSAGTVHEFRAWRLHGDPTDSVTMRSGIAEELAAAADDDEGGE